MGVLKRLPMIGKDLLEDTPVSRGCCQHRIAPSGGDTMVTVQRLYHTLPAQSTPSSAFIGHPPTTAITAYISITKNENSYAIEILVIQAKPYLEGRIRHASLAFQEVDGLGENLIEGHRCPSALWALPLCERYDDTKWHGRKGRLTMAESRFRLKHYWRVVDSEPLELTALSQMMDEKAA